MSYVKKGKNAFNHCVVSLGEYQRDSMRGEKMRIERGKKANLKELDEDLYLEANAQLYPAHKDATINVYGILTTENNVVINGSIECSEAFFGDDCHVTGSVITGGIKTGSGFKARHIEAGESVNIGNNSQVNKIDAVNDVTVGSNSRVRYAISERGTIILAAGAVADVAEAAKGTKTA
jgi:predicted acyltransferase (DUF342 family)